MNTQDKNSMNVKHQDEWAKPLTFQEAAWMQEMSINWNFQLLSSEKSEEDMTSI
jgi:hypothetical protein